MKILTRTNADWRATLNILPSDRGRYRWEVDVYAPDAQPPQQKIDSPTDFASSTNAAVDGLRAMDGLQPEGGTHPEGK